jgi:hypothetical protein
MISERQGKACRVFRTRQASISNTLPGSIDCCDHTTLVDDCCSQRSDTLAFEWRCLAYVTAWVWYKRSIVSPVIQNVCALQGWKLSRRMQSHLSSKREALVIQFRHAKGSEPARGGANW